MKYDLFISHASEDKDAFVRPLAAALAAAGLKVWYDECSLSLGDNLRRSIDMGLAESRYGLVVLSRAFFAKSWPQWELDGLIQRQIDAGNVILPIWHGISAAEVKAYSSSLANIVSAQTEDGLFNVVDKILGVAAPRGNAPARSNKSRSVPKNQRGNARLSSHTTPTSHKVVVERFSDFDNICFNLERLLDSNNDELTRNFILDNPRLLCFLLRRHCPSMIQSRPALPAPHSFDAFALHIPQWTEATLFKLGPVNQPPFGALGAWSEEFLEAVGTISGWRHSGDLDRFQQLASELVDFGKDKWPSRSGYNSIHRLRAAAQGGDTITFVLLFGRHAQINEQARSIFHGSLLGRNSFVELRSYDTILRALYSMCPSVTLDNPVVVAKLVVQKGECGSLAIDDSKLEEVRWQLLGVLGKRDDPGDAIRMIRLDLTTRGNFVDIPKRSDAVGSEHSFSVDSDVLSLAIGDNNPDDTWHHHGWHHVASYHATCSPAVLKNRLTIRYEALHIEGEIAIEFVISSVTYREIGAKLEGWYLGH